MGILYIQLCQRIALGVLVASKIWKRTPHGGSCISILFLPSAGWLRLKGRVYRHWSRVPHVHARSLAIVCWCCWCLFDIVFQLDWIILLRPLSLSASWFWFRCLRYSVVSWRYLCGSFVEVTHSFWCISHSLCCILLLLGGQSFRKKLVQTIVSIPDLKLFKLSPSLCLRLGADAKFEFMGKMTLGGNMSKEMRDVRELRCLWAKGAAERNRLPLSEKSRHVLYA